MEEKDLTIRRQQDVSVRLPQEEPKAKVGNKSQIEGKGDAVVRSPDKADNVARTTLGESIRPTGSSIQKPVVKVKSWPSPISFIKSLIRKIVISEGIGFKATAEKSGTGVNEAKRTHLKTNTLNRNQGQEIHFHTKEDNHKIEGMWFESKKTENAIAPKTILLCTGSHSSYEEYAPQFVEALTSMGHNVQLLIKCW